MKVSYNWLKDYLSLELEAEKLAEIMTDIGLEVEGVEKVESVKGGLEGIVIGEVKTVSPHPNADRLKLTKVDVGHAELLSIVCGAPNVAAGQKVVVALVGTTLYPDDKGFKIKKSKIRGELSEGMLCAEDEIGLGKSHDGIMVLDQEAKIGQAAADYFQLESDVVFEIGLTPNRVDAASHWGVARDVAAYLKLEEDIELKQPPVSSFEGMQITDFPIEIKDPKACPRYAALKVDELRVKDSPNWLKNRLLAIGLNPINNVVDVTNYVMHELGQPLHAFDLAKIEGGKVIVKGLRTGTKFTTLDEEERELSDEDLMICHSAGGMCIAGVFGGLESGVSAQTTGILLESAYFDPVSIRKTAKRHGLNTDASFRYERGADPNSCIKALQRAAYLLQEVAEAKFSSAPVDHYPEPIEDFLVELRYQKLNQLVGQQISKKTVKAILQNLEIKLLNETKEGLRLQVPAYRVDVQREVDVIEEVLRIYGYNRVMMPESMQSALIVRPKKQAYELEELISNQLSSRGFSEIFKNSLSNPAYYAEADDLVSMLNPLSRETEVMRKSMLEGGLEVIAFNQNRKRHNLKLFELGKVYRKATQDQFEEEKRFAFWSCGQQAEEGWNQESRAVDFFWLKEEVLSVLERLGVNRWKGYSEEGDADFEFLYCLRKGKTALGKIGLVKASKRAAFDVDQDVYYAELNWDALLELMPKEEITHQAVSKFPAVRRDLALLLDKQVSFEEIRKLARQTEQHLLQSVNLFDVYEGKNLPEGKKSYGLTFTFQDQHKTLKDQQIDRIMARLIEVLKEELKACLR
jgi:phenylalanyl-tRNA synthetase beta chain